MQVKSLSDCSLDWIEREEFGQEFEEVWIDWSTKIAPLWRLKLYNISLNTSFDFPFAFHCLQTTADNNRQQQQQQLQQLQQQQLDQRLVPFWTKDRRPDFTTRYT